MNYSSLDAKAYARANMKGIWAAALNPFREDFSFDEEGLRSNIRHWVDDLAIAGLVIAGKQGEFFSMSLAERKRNFEIAVEETAGKAGTIMSCSDQNFDTVIELAATRKRLAPTTSWCMRRSCISSAIRTTQSTSTTRRSASGVNIGIAMWSHPDSGYLMSPELCARVAELPNIVAIKYSVPRPMYVQLTEMVGDKILVSTASEEEWLDNILELGWQLYLCSSPPYLLQTANDRRMHDYTQAAFAGDAERAKAISASLDPVRKALRGTRPGGKPQAHQKYWQELLGQVGGPVRPPLLQLTRCGARGDSRRVRGLWPRALRARLTSGAGRCFPRPASGSVPLRPSVAGESGNAGRLLVIAGNFHRTGGIGSDQLGQRAQRVHVDALVAVRTATPKVISAVRTSAPASMAEAESER